MVFTAGCVAAVQAWAGASNHHSPAQGERDALVKLISSMRREYEAVQAAKVAQVDAVRSAKERMMLGVRFSRPLKVSALSSRPPCVHIPCAGAASHCRALLPSGCPYAC